MTWCPAHGNRTGLAPPAPQPDCRRTRRPTAGGPTAKGAQHKGGCGVLAGRRKNWGVIALARGINWTWANPYTICIALVRAAGQAGHPGRGGLGSYAGPQKNRASPAPWLWLISYSGFRLQPGITSGFYADDEGSCCHLARIRPYTVRRMCRP